MTDNQNKNNKKRFTIILSGLPAVFCSFFIPMNKKRIIVNSHFNTQFSFNSKYLFIYLLNKNYDVWFVINDDVYRNQLIREYGNHFIETNTFRGKLFALQAKLWFVSAFEMPVGGFFLKGRRRIIHLTHGSLIKNVGLLEKDISFVKKIYYRLFIRTNISYSIATSKFFVPSTAGYIGIPEKNILITGFPRNDALFVKGTKPGILKNAGFCVLYAPTWRKYEDTKLFPFEDFHIQTLNTFLTENNITIFIRLHPDNEEHMNKNLLTDRIKLFSTKECKEIMDSLSFFDGLITDYSSIAYDFLILNRPMMFLPYDYDVYNQKIGFAVDYSKITPGAKPVTLSDFMIDLLDMKTKDSYKNKRETVCRLCNDYIDNNSERLINKLTELKILE